MNKKKQTLDFLDRVISQLEKIPINTQSIGIRMKDCKGVTIQRCYIEAGLPIDALRTEDLNIIDTELISSASIPEAISLLKQLYSEIEQTSPSQTKVEKTIQRLKELIPKAAFQITVQTLVLLGHTYLTKYIISM